MAQWIPNVGVDPGYLPRAEALVAVDLWRLGELRHLIEAFHEWARVTADDIDDEEELDNWYEKIVDLATQVVGL